MGALKMLYLVSRKIKVNVPWVEGVWNLSRTYQLPWPFLSYTIGYRCCECSFYSEWHNCLCICNNMLPGNAKTMAFTVSHIVIPLKVPFPHNNMAISHYFMHVYVRLHYTLYLCHCCVTTCFLYFAQALRTNWSGSDLQHLQELTVLVGY